jgi:hypothetical protein
VYRRRRIVVLGGVLIVIAVIALIIVRPSFGFQQAQPEPEDTGTLEVVEIPACLPAQIELVAKTDQVSYAPGAIPQLWLSVTNVSTVDCRLHVGTDVQKYVITSGPEEIWNSKDCQEIEAPDQQTLRAGEQKETVAIPWNRVKSSPETCNSDARPSVIANGASYHLRVSLGDVSSPETKQFILQ